MSEVFIKDENIAARFGIARKTVWDWLNADPTFPKPFKFSPRCTRWKKSEIDAWEAQKRVTN